ncbi:MAG: hypothetical protein M3355_03120, partial [Actinomycetota bacterium]|nr:hypothetical protein [Actinomycetota bacterium]
GNAGRALVILKRQGLTLSGLVMVVAGCLWAAVALASTEVDILGPKGNETVDVAEIPDNVKNKTYNIDGQPQEIDGDSLQHVLNSIGIELDEWTRTFIDGGVVRNGEKFLDDRVPVFFVNNDDDVVFLIPKKDGEEAQKFQGNLDFILRGAIDIDPDEVNATEGDTETFDATVVDGGPQNNYTFAWTASTGETGAGRSLELTFNTSGRVEINVEAKRNGNVVAEQTIATPVKEAPPEGTGSSGVGTSGSSFGGDVGGFTPPAESFDSNFPSAGSSTPTPNFPDAPEPPGDTTVPEEELGTSVTGELLSAIAPLEPSSGKDSSGAEDTLAPETPFAEPENEEVSAPGALIATGVIVGLLGLGAGRELDNVRPRRFLRRPDLSALRRLSPPWK